RTAAAHLREWAQRDADDRATAAADHLVWIHLHRAPFDDRLRRVFSRGDERHRRRARHPKRVPRGGAILPCASATHLVWHHFALVLALPARGNSRGGGSRADRRSGGRVLHFG